MTSTWIRRWSNAPCARVRAGVGPLTPLVGAAVLIGGALLAPRPAMASSCGSRGSGGGGSSSGGGSSGGGSSGGGGGFAASQTEAARNDCSDASDVIGYRRCTKFGAWSKNLRHPRLTIEAGVLVRQFASLLDGQTASVAHGSESFSYRVLAPAAGGRALDTAILSTMRASLGLPHGLHAGLELDLGGLAQTGRAATEMMSTGAFGDPAIDQRGGLVVDSLATIGMRGAMHAGALGIELAGGVRAVSYRFHSDYHHCAQTTSVLAVAPVAELRARGELWLSPWLTAGVSVGTSLLDQAAWMDGLYLGVHSRAFGGER